MMDGNPGFAIEREIQVKKVKRALDNWREVVLVLNSVLLWKKNFYPWTILAVTTYLFVELAYYNPSLLSCFGLFGLLLTLVDYGAPYLISMIWKQEDWTSAKEREFEGVCRALASALVHLKLSYAFMMDLKATRPTMFFIISISGLSFLAVIGNSINNFLLLYIICLSLLMLPGMLHYGILQKYYSIGLTHAVNLLRSFNSVMVKPKTQ